ncbi:prenyltransferase and squalene oxidase [Colletotrichum lupini]|uniref:Prenyltransferase and squalene oxidase n=1 Tax=Colletotrichum lupini TaxID=145971 RepID=A0A9Q8WKL4_9PEZI|nr:prenyltransferase and squalene oxidase [Colletotrichum lupini]KAK1707447.1 prenyltransferase and squalene oxidase [Colletotrichum lupini]UQC86075.1 prenyltransferase and squalene oxidase [Colletotrichum lupini]
MAADTVMPLEKARHIKYWQRCHKTFLPHQYTSSDSTRIALSFFILAALDILSPSEPTKDAPHLLTPADRAAARKFVLGLYHPGGGFCGSPNHALPSDLYAGWDFEKATPKTRNASSANLASTYFALLILAIVADGPEEAKSAFAGVDRVATLRWLRRLQRTDGSFGELVLDDGAIAGGRDMRLCFLAATIRWALRGDAKEGDEDWVEDIDVDGLVRHIRQGQTYDGGVAESSHANESHAGYAWCAVSALVLLDRPPDQSGTPHDSQILQQGVPDASLLVKFLVYRQFEYLEKEDDSDDPDHANFALPASLSELTLDPNLRFVGFNGRCNKVADTCYCWWVGGTLQMLGHTDLIDAEPSRRFITKKTQHLIGGFSKYPGGPPDIFHGFLGLAALAIMGDADLKPFDASVCATDATMRNIIFARNGLIETTKATKKT